MRQVLLLNRARSFSPRAMIDAQKDVANAVQKDVDNAVQSAEVNDALNGEVSAAANSDSNVAATDLKDVHADQGSGLSNRLALPAENDAPSHAVNAALSDAATGVSKDSGTAV